MWREESVERGECGVKGERRAGLLVIVPDILFSIAILRLARQCHFLAVAIAHHMQELSINSKCYSLIVSV